MNVPFIDLKTHNESFKYEIDNAIRQVIDSCSFAGGHFVEKFEEEFAHFCDCEYAVGVGSGTEALWMSLLALGIGQGDEVITVPNTFIATAEAISFCGAKPVFVDIDKETYNIDVFQLEYAITKNTKAIIPVHLFGQMADMDPIMDVAKKYELFVIEDACQAHGAEYRGKKAGSIGDMGCFSFYPGKNLGAFGEAGALVTNNGKLAKTTRMLRDHGQIKKYQHNVIGWNCRMDGLQGAILSVKLRHLPSWNDARRLNASIYSELLKDEKGVDLPVEAAYNKHVYHIYAIRVQHRDNFIAYLANQDIQTGIHYPIPIHKQEAYKHQDLLLPKLPIAEEYAEELVSLPMCPKLNRRQIEFAVRQIKAFISGKSGKSG